MFLIILFMGNTSTIQKISYEDVQDIINGQGREFLLINTLDKNNQNCLVILPDSIRNYLSKFVDDDWMTKNNLKEK